MARKYDLISDLYRRTAEDVVSDPVVWQAFLRSASRNYRLRFDEQLLLFAQRPDATAVLSIERWNNTFGRWVNRGAKGIAVFENTSRSRQRLVHYFDISDTHESRYSHPVPIWQMQAAYTDAVVETLENTFGKLQDKENLQSAVLSAVQNAVEDNLPDYLQQQFYQHISAQNFLTLLPDAQKLLLFCYTSYMRSYHDKHAASLHDDKTSDICQLLLL